MTDRCNSLSNDLIVSRKDLDSTRHDYEILQSDYKDLKMEKQRLEDKLVASEKELYIQKNENIELQVSLYFLYF